MRAKLIDFEDLSDSREMLAAQTPNFMLYFIYLLLIILMVAFGWSWFGKIDVIVKANGVLRPEGIISVVQNQNGGIVAQLNYEEGKKVNRGDILYEIDATTLQLQLANLQDRYAETVKTTANLKLLQESYLRDEMLIEPNQVEYLNRYLIYRYNIEQLTLNLNQAEQEKLAADYLSAEIAIKRYKSEAIISVENEIKAATSKLKEIEFQLLEIKNKLKLNQIKAPVNGTIQIVREFNVGDYLPAGIEILHIIPDDSEQYKVDILVENQDISQLYEGQSVNYRFLALPYQEYGTLYGKIERISHDVILAQGETSLAYRVAGSIAIDNQEVESFPLKSGMLCEVRVIVREMKIFDYILDKLIRS